MTRAPAGLAKPLTSSTVPNTRVTTRPEKSISRFLSMQPFQRGSTHEVGVMDFPSRLQRAAGGWDCPWDDCAKTKACRAWYPKRRGIPSPDDSPAQHFLTIALYTPIFSVYGS